MSYRVSHEIKDGYVLVRFEGQQSYDDAHRFWKDLLEDGDLRDQQRFIVVGVPEKTLNQAEVRMLCLEIARMGKGKTIAYVDPNRADYDTNMYGEEVAVNRGMNTQIFTSEDEAVAWLRRFA